MSTSALKHVERCTILTDMGYGLCCRIFNAKTNLSSSRWRPQCLSNPDFLKVKQKIEKSFPENPGDMSKVPGTEVFKSTSVQIVNELTFFNDIMADISDFKKAASSLLKNIPKDILHFKLDRNRSIILLYFDLLVTYMKVLSMIASVEERKSIIAVYTYAHICSSTTDPNFSEIAQLLVSLENIQRLFIDEFSSNSDFIGGNMLQFYEVLKVHDQCENLRKISALNPTNDGEHMAQPARMTLTQRSDCDLSLYVELANADSYISYCIFGFLCCPNLLFSDNPNYLELFRLVVSDNIVVDIFRDLTLHIHNEFESVYTNYPAKRDTAVIIPKGLKIKNVLKDVAKVAATSIGAIHQARRSFVHAEVANLNHIFTAVPGLLGPKFPMVIAAASLAKAEIMHYFRHLGQEPRRDVKKHFNADQMKARNISVLINDLNMLTSLVEENTGIIQLYYTEYLAKCDYNNISNLFQHYIHHFTDDRNPHIRRLCQSIPEDLQAVDIESMDVLHNFSAFRLNWERLSTYIALSNTIFKSNESNSVYKRMNDAYERSHYVDNLNYVVKRHFVLYELWWFQTYTMEAYHEALNHTLNPLCFFSILRVIELNIHADCPEEIHRLSDSASKYFDMLIAKLGKHIETTIKALWDFYFVLETKTKPIDAARRYEKAQQLKQQKSRTVSGTTNAASGNEHEQYPGVESEDWNKKSIGKLILIKRNIMNIFGDLRYVGKFRVFDREYDIEAAARQHLYMYFENRITEIILGSTTDIERPTIVLSNAIVGIRVMQVAFDYINSDTQHLLRTVLYQNFCDTSLPPPGASLAVSAKPSPQLIGKIGEWFVRLVAQASSTESGHMWVPYTNEFAYHKSASSVVEMYIKRDEMKALCTYIGPQGVRAINAMLLAIVSEKIAYFKEFLNSNKAILLQIQAQKKPSLCASLVNANMFLENSVIAGIALSLRESLHQGLSDAIGQYAPYMQSALDNIVNSVDPWTDKAAVAPLFSMAYDAGCQGVIDLELCDILSNRVQSYDDKLLFSLLPYAYGASFISSFWNRNSSYVPSLDAFTSNQHCIALTISRMLMSYSGISIPASTDPSVMSAITRKAFRDAADVFLEISSNVILHMKMKESEFASYPIRGMACILELFTKLCPLVDRSMLEIYLPYAFLHTCYMDIALGKLKFSDNISSGITAVVNAV